ncbi:MAG: helix-turn-helix transcriptional regulator [Candidatus Nitrotoga sp.]
MNKFSEWMTKQFVQWQAEQGTRKTLEEFAAYVGVSRPLINMWMNGNQKPGAENIKLMGELFGSEIYDVLELPRPNPHLQKINRLWEFLPEEIQIKLAKETEKYETQNELHRLQKSSKPRKVVKPK